MKVWKKWCSFSKWLGDVQVPSRSFSRVYTTRVCLRYGPATGTRSPVMKMSKRSWTSELLGIPRNTVVFFSTKPRWWFQTFKSQDLRSLKLQSTWLGGCFNIFYFHPYLGEWSNLTHIFQMGLKPPPRFKSPIWVKVKKIWRVPYI